MADIKGTIKSNARRRRQKRVRSRIHGTAQRPRLSVFRSLDNIFVQVIDDEAGVTLASASTIDREVAPKVQGKSKVEAAQIVGKSVAERALAAGVKVVVFDRGSYRYHGRVAALADGAREAGLEF